MSCETNTMFSHTEKSFSSQWCFQLKAVHHEYLRNLRNAPGFPSLFHAFEPRAQTRQDVYENEKNLVE